MASENGPTMSVTLTFGKGRLAEKLVVKTTAVHADISFLLSSFRGVCCSAHSAALCALSPRWELRETARRNLPEGSCGARPSPRDPIHKEYIVGGLPFTADSSRGEKQLIVDIHFAVIPIPNLGRLKEIFARLVTARVPQDNKQKVFFAAGIGLNCP